jgi:hypothetical protein
VGDNGEAALCPGGQPRGGVASHVGRVPRVQRPNACRFRIRKLPPTRNAETEAEISRQASRRPNTRPC